MCMLFTFCSIRARDNFSARVEQRAKNQMRKAVNKPKKFTDLKEATLAQLAAKKKLRLARIAGDAEQIAAALNESNEADAAIRAAHTQRFQKNAAMRGSTALAALDELTKLARKQRYTVTAGQAAAIMEPLHASVTELDAALQEAQRRGAPPAKRGINFAGTEARAS